MLLRLSRKMKKAEKVKELRSRIMRSVPTKNTKPELVVRNALRESGIRFKLHCSALPGKPDLVLTKYRIAVFVNGCFWHQHSCRRGNRIPKSNRLYWSTKLKRNVERDIQTNKKLKAIGWRRVVIWECEVSKLENAIRRISRLIREKTL